MRLTEITAHSFRNLTTDPVFFADGVTLIAGETAQGKTPEGGKKFTRGEKESSFREVSRLAPTVFLAPAVPSRWSRWAGAVIQMRAGAAVARPQAVNDWAKRRA